MESFMRDPKKLDVYKQRAIAPTVTRMDSFSLKSNFSDPFIIINPIIDAYEGVF
jgi:hypothetical protein